MCTYLPVHTESDVRTERTVSPQSNQSIDNESGKSRENSGWKSNIIPKVDDINERTVTAGGRNSSDVVVAVTRTHVRTALPKGTWWLPIRVLKGFLVLQGQVRTVTERTVSTVRVLVPSVV
jgi:hypothetical protein